MGDFLVINGRGVGVAATNTTDYYHWRDGGKNAPAYGDEAIFWYLAFEKLEDARKWYDISAMEF